MVHRIVWRVAAPEALDFWAARLAEHGVETERAGDRLRFADPEGLEHELTVVDVSDAPLIADHPEIPREHALQGFDGVRAYASDPARSEALLRDDARLRSGGENGEWEVARRRARRPLRLRPAAGRRPPLPGRGHASTTSRSRRTMDEQEAWRERVAKSGNARPTPVIDRF